LALTAEMGPVSRDRNHLRQPAVALDVPLAYIEATGN
jgi:hypothetical protein